jgi:hypothetical protein
MNLMRSKIAFPEGMFGLFSKKHEPEIAYDQAVILEIDLASLNEFNTSEQIEAVRTLEKELESILSSPDGIDGDEFGDGGVTIYLYGKSADKICKTITPILGKSPFTHVRLPI